MLLARSILRFGTLALPAAAFRYQSAAFLAAAAVRTGADADFLLGGLLLDCKATIMPGKLGADEVSQLAVLVPPGHGH